MADYEEAARRSARIRKDRIVEIPSNCVIDEKYLGTMTNGDFVSAFRALQVLLRDIYTDVEKNPFNWGYPEINYSESACSSTYNRIADLLYALGVNGTYDNGTLSVRTKGFYYMIRTHKKQNLLLDKMREMNVVIEDHTKKSPFFHVSYPLVPQMLNVLCIYTQQAEADLNFFSYRWVESPASQKYETIFLAKIDSSPQPIREIQYWLYHKAKEYGYRVDTKKSFDKDCVNYKNGSKQFILAGEREFMEFGFQHRMFTRVIFREVFTKAPGRVSALAKKAPDVLGGAYSNCTRCNGMKGRDEPCSMRICYEIDGSHYESCSYRSFWFFNPTLDLFRDIFELFIIENNIQLP